MLEIGAVVDTRGEHDNGWIFDATGRCGTQSSEQFIRVFADRLDSHLLEKLRQSLGHDAAVRNHIAHARWHANVVFEHSPGANLIANQVDAADLNAHPVGRVDAVRGSVKVLGCRNQRSRNHTITDGILRAINIGQKSLENFDALLDAGIEHVPLWAVDNSRHSIERERSLFTGEVEGNTLGQI